MYRLWVIVLLFACKTPVARERTPLPQSAPSSSKSKPTSTSKPQSQPATVAVSRPNIPPAGALPLGVVIRLESFLEEDPLSTNAASYLGLLCLSSVEGLFIEGGFTRGVAYCGVKRIEVKLTKAKTTLIFSPK